jgi:predicted MFS family arabinose efflux permease
MTTITSSSVPHIPTLDSESRVKEVLLLIILAAIQFSFLMDYILLMPLGPQLIRELNIDPKLFSYIISSYTFSAAIAGFIGSFYIDKLDRKKMLLFVYAGFSIGPFLCALSPNFQALLLARIFTGAFGGILTSVIMTVLGDAIPTERLGRATSYVIAANGAASVIGVPTGLFIAGKWGWQAPFYILGSLAFLLLITINVVFPSMKKHLENAAVNRAENIKKVLKNPDFIWPIIFMSLLTFAGGFTILPFLSTYMSGNMGFSGADISFLFFLGGLASFFAGPVAGNLIDKFGKQNMFLLINFLSIIPILLVTIYPLDSKIFALTATTLFFMLSTGRHVSGMALINSRFSKDQRGQFLSVNYSIQMLAGTAGTILSGYILYTEDKLLMNFDILGIIAICATILCIFTAFILEE